jgi:N12 class adenine-specific DNA methylase
MPAPPPEAAGELGRSPEELTHGSTAYVAAGASTHETHVMQRLLRPDPLREVGVEAFDAWAATFGETVTEVRWRPKAANRSG